VAPFVEAHPLSDINPIFAAVHRHEIRARVVLQPR
jgi:D-arabinose 1-dehydrogenase-like Zn-dependent alcohol dehydrogenase